MNTTQILLDIIDLQPVIAKSPFLQSTGSTAEPVLVIYVLLESTEASNEANFQYYLREGIRENDGCLHIILVDPQRVSKLYFCT